MKATPIQTNFTGGEMSPKLHGRVDIAKYNNCARLLRNVIPLIFGGAESRDGLRYVESTKNSARRARLIQFVFNVNQSYILELGHLYMRVFTNGGQVESSPGVPYEIATPFEESHLADIKFAQSADTMILVHELVYSQRLQRFGHADWRMENLPFTIPPMEKQVTYPAANLTLSSVSAGSGRTATASAAVWLAADVGRVISAGAGYATITAVASGTSATVNIDSAFASTSIASGSWALNGPPMASIVVSSTGGVQMAEGMTVTAALASAGWRVSDIGKYITNMAGNNSSGNVVFLITAFTSPTSVSALVKYIAPGVGNSWTGWVSSWDLRSNIYNSNSYPSAVVFKDQRLYLGGGLSNPSRISGSETANILSFSSFTSEVAGGTFQVLDSSGFDFKINESQEPITHLVNIRNMMALTLSGAFLVTGGVEKPITPTNIQVKDQSDNGSNMVKPVRINNELYFVHRAGKKLFSTSYSIEQDGYDSSDVSKIAEHIARIGITEMTYQREPNSLLYCVLADGKMATITIDREENVIAWALHETDGVFESVACVPISDGEQVWVIVRRVINGVSVRQVELFDSSLVMDSAIIGNAPGGAAVWSGLGHLEGKDVVVMADGKYAGEHVVTAGEIVLDKPAVDIQIGLSFQQHIQLLPVEIATQTGTTQGKNVGLNAIYAKFIETLGAKIYTADRLSNAETVGRLVFNESTFDTPPAGFTGTHKVETLGTSTTREPEETTVNIIQTYPLKMHVLSVAREVTVND